MLWNVEDYEHATNVRLASFEEFKNLKLFLIPKILEIKGRKAIKHVNEIELQLVSPLK